MMYKFILRDNIIGITLGCYFAAVLIIWAWFGIWYGVMMTAIIAIPCMATDAYTLIKNHTW